MELRELFDSGSDTRVYYVGALGAAAGVVVGVLAGLDGNVFVWASLGAVVGLVAGLLAEEYRANGDRDR